jgi:sulfur-oxidizing protein SoxX
VVFKSFGLAVSLAVGLGLASAASAETIAPESVKIVDATLEQSLTGQPGDAAKGRKWFVGRKLGNCLACHQNSETSEEQFHGEVGPLLDGVASRYEPAQLRAIIVDSKKVFGDQSLMPAFYRATGLNRVHKKFAGKTILNAQQVEDVLAYLLTLKEE